MTSLPTHRKCGECTECCRGVLVIEELGVERGSPCERVTCNGCSRYDERPEVCSAFSCGWIKYPHLFPHWMRPDKCGVVIKTDTHVWNGVPVDTIIATGNYLPSRAEKFLKKMGIKKTRFQIFEVLNKAIPYGHPQFIDDYMNSDVA